MFLCNFTTFAELITPVVRFSAIGSQFFMLIS